MIVKITKKNIISIVGLCSLLISGIINYAMGQAIDTEVYESVLYRINAGGATIESSDPSVTTWEDDDFLSPSQYSNYLTTQNKVYETADIISFHSSVPSGTPDSLFNQERGIGTWDVNTMEWDFPVEPGKEIEIRLYFAEIYFTEPNIRVFDVYADDQLILNDYDILADVGHDVGVMKSFIVTTIDNNLDLNFTRVKNQPKVNAIEILQFKEDELEVTSTIVQNESEISIHPNPFNNYITIKGSKGNFSNGEVLLYNSMGELIKRTSVNNFDTETTIDLSDVHKGIYYLSFNSSGPVRIVKF